MRPGCWDFGDNFGPFTVGQSQLFMMGDNRDNSNDSRYWGPLDMDLVKGRAMFLYWSWDGTRWRLLALREPPPVAGAPLWLGLPKGAALVLYGVGLLPLLVLPLAYALTFEGQTLSEADLERVRRAASGLRAAEAGAEAPSDASLDARRHGDAMASTEPPFAATPTTRTSEAV